METAYWSAMRHARHPAALRLPAARESPLAHQQGQARSCEEDTNQVPRQRRGYPLRELGVQRDQPDTEGREGRECLQRVV